MNKQVEVITKFFSSMFNKDTEMEMESISPCRMITPFTSDEVLAAITVLKVGKRTGVDNIHAEILKCGPKEISKEISDIYNEMAETGKFAEEIKKGILVPIPKPGNKAGTPEHLRPIILLSALLKILAICMLRRCLHKMLKKVPLTQAAYQQGRSTTEMICSFEVLAEKATTSKDL